MPGLLGMVGGRDADVRTGFSAVLKEMDRGGRLVAESRIDPRGQWALGRVHLGVLQPEPQLGHETTVNILFHGDLHNAQELRATLTPQEQAEASGDASLVRALYKRHGRAFARSLKGAFCAVIHDQGAGELLLVADRLGSYPLYWFTVPSAIVFASELRAALKAHPRPAINPRAVADFLKFGFPMGDRTLAAGVDMVPSSATLRYRLASGDVDIEAYGSIEELFKAEDQSEQAYHARVEKAFAESMERNVRGNHRLGLSLSGGLDTRVILAALDRLDRSAGVASFTLGGRGCADEVIAYDLAKMGRTNHTFVALDDHYLADIVPTVGRMVTLTDGMYLSHGFTEMLALKGFEESDAQVLLRGHGGELSKASTAWPLHTDARILSMRSTDEFVPYMFERLTHVSHGNTALKVFADDVREGLDGDARRSLEETVNGVKLSPGDLCSYLYLKEYHRRVTIPSLEIFRNSTEVRMPLADAEYVRTVLTGSTALRDGVRVHQMLIGANKRSYLGIRNPNTGAPAGAGPLTEAVLDKVNSVLRRLNVYGYRHYHAFDGWMRKALLETVDKFVLDPATLSRGVFSESRVRQMVGEAHGGSKEHDDLLQALVIVELWQREYA